MLESVAVGPDVRAFEKRQTSVAVVVHVVVLHRRVVARSMEHDAGLAVVVHLKGNRCFRGRSGRSGRVVVVIAIMHVEVI